MKGVTPLYLSPERGKIVTLCELYKLRAGRTRCKVCGGKACTGRKCRICASLDGVVGEAVEDLLKDYGFLLSALPVPPQLGNSFGDFVNMLKLRASTKTSKRLVHVLEMAAKRLDELK